MNEIDTKANKTNKTEQDEGSSFLEWYDSVWESEKESEKIKDFKLTEHFSFFELTSTSHSDLLDQNRIVSPSLLESGLKLAELLEKVRSLENKPVIINSGFRCPKLNKKIGGSKTSQHMLFEAADLYVKKVPINETMLSIVQSSFNYGQLIYYPERFFIHISLGAKRQNLVFTEDTGYIPLKKWME